MAIRRKRQLISRGMGGNRNERFRRFQQMLQGSLKGSAPLTPQTAQNANRHQPVRNTGGCDSDGGSDAVAASARTVEEEARKSEAAYRGPAPSV